MTTLTPDSRWLHLAFDSWLLACDAALVIWLRLGRLALMDKAALAEGELMVGEKLEAVWQLQWRALTGQLGTSQPAIARRSVAHYRRKVTANRRRLGA
ncbi:hypothetical protein H7F51_03900 [Novosphingobium flavum]|uniref:Uncharacterized protein n=1 Tax=Novosphingobium flavum TaxID=1778672 RepID=A0A7X1FPV4_9SPHN|nr:hypothetical protein [Novosphingobium flavum]MBC2664659.1 hypothetical protein [Novosphingobium flavum]